MKALLCSVLLAALAMTAAAADLTGTWSGTFTSMRPDGPHESGAYLVLKQTGTQLTGTAGPNESDQWAITNGKVEGNKMTGEAQRPQGPLYKFTLILTGERLKGDVTGSQPDGPPLTAKLDVGRVK